LAEKFEPLPWKPSLTIRASFALHAAAGVATIVHPPAWPWALGALAANHALLTALGLWPRSTLLGPNMLRLPEEAARRGEVALTVDDGPDPVATPAMLDVLGRYGAKASFFCVGVKAGQYPDLVREIVRQGHSVENHSNLHSNWFSFYGMRRLRREIDSAQATLSSLSGRSPQYFRAPAGLRSPLLDLVIARLGLRYVTWTRRGFDTVTRNALQVLGRLTRGLAAGDILLLHDGGCASTASGRPVAVEVLPPLLELIAARGLKCVSLPSAKP
jgi:peptidoglycan/xylan/chitin deacetylase (PgdA/CDA1 family)